MSLIGHPVRYRVPKEHLAETVKGQDGKGRDIVVAGSVHHPERTEFAGTIEHSRVEGKTEVHDITIFVGGKPIHLRGVTEGDGPGTLTLFTPPAKK